MKQNANLRRLRHLAMTGVTLTVCGTALALYQANVQADTTTANATEATGTAQSTVNNESTTADNSNTAVATAASQPVAAVAQAQTTSSLQTTNPDYGNYGYLERADISNGELQLSGWNANGTASNRPYHKIIVVDAAGHELGRTDAVTQDRSDVAAIYGNNSGAYKSGWSAQFTINNSDWFNQPLRVVSRYSNDASANNTDADYWFTPVRFDNNNEGHMDGWSFADGNLTANGWHATNASYQNRSHWIIIFDRTKGHEIKRFKLSTSQRPDVAKVFSGIYDSLNSGWQISYNFGGDAEWLTDQLQIISRYSDDQDNGEGNHVDYWYPVIQSTTSNQAALDSATISGGQLHLAGWHATNGEFGRNNHYIIVLDSAGHELARQKVTNVARPDVGRIYQGVYDADQSGWSADFALKPAMVSGPIQIVSRYTSSADGNSNYIDYWFAPVRFDHNYSQITGVHASGQQLTITGYHAADAAYAEPNHFLILFDNTANRQIAATKTTSAVTPTAAKSLNAYNASSSGFSGTLTLPANLDRSHQYSLVLRYSADGGDNGNNAAHTDTWLGLSHDNLGHLDDVDLSNGNLVVGGWHANDISVVAPYHHLIIYDNTAQRQVATKLVTDEISRADITRAFPKFVTGGVSGFQVNFGRLGLTTGHSYSVVSRYSTTAQGNGDGGYYQDLWLGPFTLNQTEGAVDSFSQGSNSLRVRGWLASDQLLSANEYPYVIALVDGKEIGRARITNFQSRPDVAHYFGQIYNSANSGFTVTIPLNKSTTSLKDNTISFILRVTDDPAGNGHFTDRYCGHYATNTGQVKLDFNRNNNTLNVSGWHAAMGASSRPYQFVIVLGADGHEFYRRRLNSTTANQSTSDGTKQAGYIANAGQSGFGITLPVTDAMNHWGIRVLHRYTNDPAGNGDYIDISSPVLGINDGFQRLYGGTVYYDPTTGHRATGWRTINGQRYYFSDGYETQSMPDDLWVYNDKLKGQMYTGVNYVDGHCYDFGSDGVARAQPQNDWWTWPFPSVGQGSFATGQAFGYSSYARTNHYHDGLDFGAYDHPGSEVHAVHGAKVLDVNTCRDSKGQTMWWYIIAWDGRYLYVYQEAFQTRAQIAVNPGQIIYPGQVIGWRNTSHLHLGINTSPNYGMDLAHSFQPSWSDPNAATGSGTWLDPQWLISHQGN